MKSIMYKVGRCERWTAEPQVDSSGDTVTSSDDSDSSVGSPSRLNSEEIRANVAVSTLPKRNSSRAMNSEQSTFGLQYVISVQEEELE